MWLIVDKGIEFSVHFPEQLSTDIRVQMFLVFRSYVYGMFQKELYNFESLYKFIQGTSTVFKSVIT
jgi:hypothetical protein